MHILTFDIEDWFHTFDDAYYGKVEKWASLPAHLEDNINRICDFLAEYHSKATFFWLGWEAKRFPGLIKSLAENGHEIAAHSFYHQKINDLDKRAFKKDTEKVIKTLEDLTGEKVKSYRAPGMSINDNTLWALDILYELGIENDSSVVSVKRSKFPDVPFVFHHNGIEIKEFPVPALSALGNQFNYSSSGYFRISPYRWLREKISQSDYMLFYFHPRDFDTDVHKMFPGNIHLKLRYRFGTKKALSKLEKILKPYSVLNIAEAERRIDWSQVPKIKM